MIILGLLLGIIGADVNSGTFRFDFGIAELQDGIDFVAISRACSDSLKLS